MKYLLLLVLAFMAFPTVYGFLSSHGMGGASAIVVLVVIAVVLYNLPAKIWAALAILWLLWSFLLPVWRSVDRAIANGEKAPGRLIAAATAAAQTALGKLLGKGFSIPFSGARNLAQAQDDIQAGEKLCEGLSFVQTKFGDSSVANNYCQGQDNPFPKVNAYKNAIQGAVAGPALPFVAQDPAALATQPYYDCLTKAVTPQPNDSAQEAAVRSQAAANSKECYSNQSIYSVPLQWRMCMELAIQLPRVDALTPTPLAPEIAQCRASIPGLP
jgi:hypothetical protein